MGVLVVNLGCELGIWNAMKDGRQVSQVLGKRSVRQHLPGNAATW